LLKQNGTKLLHTINGVIHFKYCTIVVFLASFRNHMNFAPRVGWLSASRRFCSNWL